MSFGHSPACKEQWTENRSFCHFRSSLSGNLGIWLYNLGYCVYFKKTVTEAATECAACLATGVGMQFCSLYWYHNKADFLSCPLKASKFQVQTFKSANLKSENTFNAHLRTNTLVPTTSLNCGLRALPPPVQTSKLLPWTPTSDALQHLDLFLFQVTAAWQALPGHCPAVSGVAQ